MKPGNALSTLITILAMGAVSSVLAQDGQKRYRLSSSQYKNVPVSERLAKLKAVNEKFNRNYGKAIPDPKRTQIRINETKNTQRVFAGNATPNRMKTVDTASRVRPNTASKGLTTRSTAGNGFPNMSKDAMRQRGVSRYSDARTLRASRQVSQSARNTRQLARGARTVQQAAQGARTTRQVAQGARTARQIAQGARVARTGATAGKAAMAGTGVGLAVVVASEVGMALVEQEIKDPGKTMRDINGTANDIKTGQFLPKAGQKINRAVSDTGKALDQAGKDVGNFVSGLFR